MTFVPQFIEPQARRVYKKAYGQAVIARRNVCVASTTRRSGDGQHDLKSRASHLYDEAKVDTQNKTVVSIAPQAPIRIPNIITSNVVPLAAAASAAVVCLVWANSPNAVKRRERKRGNTSSTEKLLNATTATGEPAWLDPSQSPIPQLDIAGDAFSSFTLGEQVGGDVGQTSDRNVGDVNRMTSSLKTDDEKLRAELADLESDLAKFEAALKSGGKALANASDRYKVGLSANKSARLTTHSGTEEKTNSEIEPPASASSNQWWDVDIDERSYRPAFGGVVDKFLSSGDTSAKNENRRVERKEKRVKYFRTNIAVRAASVRVAAKAEADLLRRLAPNSPLDARVFDSREIGVASYGVALAALCKEQNLGEVRGEGTFSDVYATSPNDYMPSQSKPGDWSYTGSPYTADSGPPRFCSQVSDDDSGSNNSSSTSPINAVIKCSVPFPGVINGRFIGDGLGIGEVEARVLAQLPRHPNVVKLLAAFLSAERNESYLLLKDAGQNLHTLREEGNVSPKDVRWHAREVLKALAHCHVHGVIHRDVKGGNILVDTGADKRSTVLIDFGVARQRSIVDKEPPRNYGTPGYQAPELLMSDMAEVFENNDSRSFELYSKVDMFAFGCTLFFLCIGKELFGPTVGSDGDEYGARTKTKARAQATQESIVEVLEMVTGGIDAIDPSIDTSVEEQMVVRKRSPSVSVTETSENKKLNNFAAVALQRALGGATEKAAEQSETNENDLDMLMLRSMAEFPGYEPTTVQEKMFVRKTYNSGPPNSPPPHRESLAAFVNRKITPRQPPGFASLIGACLSRDPDTRPTALEALSWPGAWVELEEY